MNYFFLSYSRPEETDRRKITKFYEDLCNEIKKITGKVKLKNHNIGFFDKGIQNGENWDDKIGKALHQSPVMVCLFSAYYFESEFCGKEWKAFTDRIYEKTGKRTSNAIQPIIWSPISDFKSKLPNDINKLNTSNFKFKESQYLKYGFEKLLTKRPYDKSINEFARTIVKINRNENRLTESKEIPTYSEISNSFCDINLSIQNVDINQNVISPKIPTNRVYLMFVVGSIEEIEPEFKVSGIHSPNNNFAWFPFKEEDVIELTHRFVAQEGYQPSPLDFDPNYLEKLKKAEKENRVVILFVDSWTLGLQQYRTILNKYDNIKLGNCAVLIPQAEIIKQKNKSAVNPRDYVEYCFKKTKTISHQNYFWYPVNSEKDLTKNLLDSIIYIQSALIASAKHYREIEGGFSLNNNSIDATK